jgi:hypothetical protein
LRYLASQLLSNIEHLRMDTLGATTPPCCWLKKQKARPKSKDGVSIAVYELVVADSDAAALSAWAKRFREHYCLDSRIDKLRSGTKKSRAEYLRDMVFPDKADDFGPATRG